MFKGLFWGFFLNQNQTSNPISFEIDLIKIKC